MTKIQNVLDLGKLDEHLLERVLCAYHEWGFCSMHVLSRLCSEYQSRLAKYNKLLCDKKYIVDLGNLRVVRDSKLKGRWYAVTRKPPAPFTFVPTRRQNLVKTTTPGAIIGNYDYTTTFGYVIPRHQILSVYAVSWVADVLNFHMGAGGSYSTLGLTPHELAEKTTGFSITSEHLIRTLAGHNRCLTEEQMVAMNASTTSAEGYNMSVPDARIYVRQANVNFRVEVECSVKNYANYARLGDVFKSQGLPILYLYASPTVLKKVSLRLNHPLISHVMIHDLIGLRDFFWKNGILLPFMPHGSIDDPETMFPPA